MQNINPSFLELVFQFRARLHGVLLGHVIVDAGNLKASFSILDRDPQTQDLVMVGTAWNCDWVRKYAGKARGLYVAFRLRPGVRAEAIPMPDWAWGRTRNLYLTYFEIEPPKRVTPGQAEWHNKTDARGAPEYFRIDPTIRFCEENSHAR